MRTPPSFATPTVLFSSPPRHCRRCTQRHTQCHRQQWSARLPPLEAAISSGLVADVGRSVPLSPDGRLSLAGPPDWVPPSSAWRDAVDVAVGLLRERLGESLVSMHVRGSAAAGHLFDGSDLDLIVLTTTGCGETSASLARVLSDDVRREFPFVSGVDVGLHTLPEGDAGPGDLPEAARFLLLAYSARAFGASLAGRLGHPSPPRDTLVDIRARQRRALASPSSEATGWFIKGALRGLVDLAARDAGRHARDLVPCARILTEAYPEHAELLSDAVVLACDPAECIRSGTAEAVMHDVADLAEREYLRDAFGEPNQGGWDELAPAVASENASENASTGTQVRWMHDFASAVDNAAAVLRRVGVPKSFVRDEFPAVRLPAARAMREESAADDSPPAGLSKVYLRKHPAPIVFRAALGALTPHLSDSRSLARTLLRSPSPADVRISPGNVFTFCRSTHPLISSGKFTPPSVLVRIPSSEFIRRLSSDASARPPPIRYANERTYQQTAVRPRERLFRLPSSVLVGQGERRWVSTHGSISPLHFDAAHSALVQVAGRKRMIFFPPSALKWMGVYPAGHPLQRRAAVDLGRPEARMFRMFWENFARLAEEVVLEAGDLVVFPPGWSHYTESVAEEGGLSVSHTLRFLVEGE